MAASNANIVVTRNTNRAKRLHQKQFMLAVELLSSAAAALGNQLPSVAARAASETLARDFKNSATRRRIHQIGAGRLADIWRSSRVGAHRASVGRCAQLTGLWSLSIATI